MKIFIAILLSLGFLCPSLSNAQFNIESSGQGQTIVIMDSGMVRGDFFRNRVSDQWCWSRPSVLRTPETANPESRHYPIFSMCRNGGRSDFNSSDAAEIPISTFHNIMPFYTNHVFGTNHGSTVLGEAAVTAAGAQFLIINNTFYNANETSRGFDGVIRTCGVHGPHGTSMPLQGVQQPADTVGCYTPHDAERQSEVIAI